ncbi:MAG: hypothetical protein MRZ66_08880 [Clostridiales bacterium]|nr:hypothetical protein [Clostridiales bacterium]
MKQKEKAPTSKQPEPKPTNKRAVLAAACFVYYIKGKLKSQARIDIMATFTDIIELHKKSGLSQRQFSEMLNIPLRTWESWERNLRTPPQYLIDLIFFKITHSDLSKYEH